MGALALVAAVALVIGSARSGRVSNEDRTDSIAARVKCPTCQGLSVAQSRTGLALAIHEEIGRQVELGRTDAQIMSYISGKYGDGLITNPPATGAGAVVWVAPVAFVVVAFVGLGLALRRWSLAGRRSGDLPSGLDDVGAVRRARAARSGETSIP